MRPPDPPKLSPIALRQVIVWQRLQTELEEFVFELDELPRQTPPSGLLVELVRQHRTKLYRFLSRENFGRALEKFPAPPLDRACLIALLHESRLALGQFRKLHSSEFSEREDGFVIEEDF
ncbi:hypothetical protein [Devosia sp. FJ2-5-3]|uniref:hypothetical protein n=1 Tax=Devosia sp. FJ2-5-3 TaxID=2976680 RepID=UPI0023D80C83|nr:hypothetical protein [Devosia sp. FJ2-5-3]WEJ59599.1 hypothetical protein N0P34_06125 [Devosia sp. FJ2-5-3]